MISVNVGGADRMLRILVGLGLIGLALFGGKIWGWLGLVPLLTGLFRFCPAYFPFGFQTCSRG